MDLKEEQKSNNLKRFMRHYLSLFPLTEKLTPLETKRVAYVFKGKDLNLSDLLGKTLTLVCKSSSVKAHFAYLLTKLPFLSEGRFLTLTDIIDIQFATHPMFKSIREITSPIIMVYVDPITNKLKDEYLSNAVEFWCMNNRAVWIYFKGQAAEWCASFPKTVEYAKQHRFTSLDLNAKITSKQEVLEKIAEVETQNNNEAESLE